MCEPCSGDPDEGGDAEADGKPHAEADEEVVPLDEDEEGERADDTPQEARFRPGSHASIDLTLVGLTLRPTAAAVSVERPCRIRAPRRHGRKRSASADGDVS